MHSTAYFQETYKQNGKTHNHPRGLKWVTNLPGDGGVDWGFGLKDRAIDLTPHWQRRFAAYCRAINREAHFPEVEAAALLNASAGQGGRTGNSEAA